MFDARGSGAAQVEGAGGWPDRDENRSVDLVEIVQLDGVQDWALWRTARLAALGDAPQAFPGAWAQWSDGGEALWRERLLDAAALTVVAVRAGGPVGLVRGVMQGRCAWLHSLWVSPQVRGQGLGDQLVVAVEVWAARRGATRLRLEVVPDNAPAIALYRRHAYVDAAALAEVTSNGDSELVMEKMLRR